MKLRIVFACAVCLVVTCSIAVADSRAPDPKPPKDADTAVPFVIRGNSGTRTNRLTIPRHLLSGATGSRNDVARTIIAGIAISLAAVALVFLLLRKKSQTTKVVASVVVFAAVSLQIPDWTSNAIASNRSNIVANWWGVDDAGKQVVIEIVEEGDSVELVLGTYQRRQRSYGRKSPEPAPKR